MINIRWKCNKISNDKFTLGQGWDVVPMNIGVDVVLIVEEVEPEKSNKNLK